MRQVIDGVISPQKTSRRSTGLSPSVPHPTPRPLHPPIHTLPPKRPLGPERKQPALARPNAALVAPSSSPAASPSPTRRPRPRVGFYLQWGLLLAVALLLGSFAESLVLGQAILAVYGAAAVVWRIKSGTTFALAIVAIVTVVIFFTGQQNGRLANNFAVYTFWLLVIGMISLVIEVRRDQMQKAHRK